MKLLFATKNILFNTFVAPFGVFIIMRNHTTLFILFTLLVFASCEKWKDTPAKDLGLTNRYCNNPIAINYNHNFPGIEDNSVCIFPNEPFVGIYAYRDSIYNSANDLLIGDSITFQISKDSIYGLRIAEFCASGSVMNFTADRYYRALSDTIIGAGAQLMCRTLDTLQGSLVFRSSDSSLYIDWLVTSDTAISTHRGRAYKK